MNNEVKSFGVAFKGIAGLVLTQRHARFHALATTCVVVAGWWLEVSRDEWMALVLSMGLVWTAEAINTAVEFLGDAITMHHHPLIGRAKDVAAGGVLIASITAAIIGMLVFIP